MSDCADCGSFDVEWMYKCHKHGLQYCRGCSCPECDEEELDEYEDLGAADLEDQLEHALNKAFPQSNKA